MMSSMANLTQPPLMSAAAQDPSLFRQGLANFKENANTPQGKVAMAMMQQQLGKMGGALRPGLMTRRPSPFAVYGQPVG